MRRWRRTRRMLVSNETRSCPCVTGVGRRVRAGAYVSSRCTLVETSTQRWRLQQLLLASTALRLRRALSLCT